MMLVTMTNEELMQNFEQIVRKVLEQMHIDQESTKQKEFYTREEVSKLLDVSVTTLHNWNKEGILTNTKIGKRVYYSKSAVLSRINL